MGVILLMLKMEKHKETPFSRFEDVTLKFLALSVSMIVGHYSVQCCLCSDEAERNETLMIYHGYRKNVEFHISVMTTFHNPLKHFCPSPIFITFSNPLQHYSLHVALSKLSK